MCGRFVLGASAEQLELLFDLAETPRELEPRYNIAPTQPVAIVRLKEGKRDAPDRELTYAQWGLIPSWAKDPSIGSKTINARSEGVDEKPSFRAAFKRRRCLVPATGFYEWKKRGSSKEPYFISMEDGEPFAFAGLWETWSPADGGQIDTCTILTTEPNELMAELHNRMPVILRREDYAFWLGAGKDSTTQELGELKSLLLPYAAEEMVAWPVAAKVGNPRNQGAELIKSTRTTF